MLACGALASPMAQAQTAAAVKTVNADVPPGSLADALNHFALQAGVAIAVDADKVKGKTSPGLQGSVTIDEGFRKLLEGSGYGVSRTPAGYVLVRSQPASAAPAPAAATTAADVQTLQTVQVTGQAERPDQLPGAYAGGQVARGGSVGFLGNSDVFETPFNVTNFTAQSIENLQARRIEEVLKTDPAVRVANVGTGWYQDFMIRGFRVTGDATLFNGLAGIYPPYSQMATPGVERIEVFKGANSFLAGVGSGLNIGGTINLVPKRATDAPVTQVVAEYAEASRAGVQLDVGRRFGDTNQFGARITGYSSDGLTTIDNERERLQFYSAALDYRSATVRLALDLGRSEQNSEASLSGIGADPSVQIPKPPRRGSNYQQPFAYSDTAYDYQVVRGEWDIVKGTMLYATYGGSQASYKQILPFALLHDSDGNIDEIYQNGSGRERSNAWNIGILTAFETGPVEHQLAITATRNRDYNQGAYVFDEASGSQATIVSNLYNPTRGIALRPDMVFPEQVPNYRSDNKSVAIADTLGFMDRQLLLTIGVRHQSVGSVPLSAPEFAYDKSALTPAAAVLYKLTPAFSVYANYIESLEGGPTAPSNAVNRDEVFAPSKDKQREIGVKYDGGKLGATAALYEIDKATGILDPVTRVFGLNGRQLNRGFEFNVFGEPWKGVRLQGGFVVTDARLDKTENGEFDGKHAAKVARNNIALGGEWDTPFLPGLTLTAQVNRSGPVYLDQDNTQQIDAFVEADLGLRYATRLGGTPTTLRATVTNAFNANHWVADVYGSFFQSAPRTLRMSATFDF